MEHYPDYLLYASAEEVKARLNHQQLTENQKMLNKCDDIIIREIDGEFKAVVDIEVYQHLVSLLIDTVEKENKK